MFSIWSGAHHGLDHRYQHPHLEYAYPSVHDILGPAKELGSAEVHTSKDNFVVKLDTRHFTPEQLIVKTVDGFLCVEGEHEEKTEAAGHKYTTRGFTRRFLLPVNCKDDELRCEIGHDGILKATIPRHNPSAKGKLHSIAHNAMGHAGVHHPFGRLGLGHGDGHQHELESNYWVSGIDCNKHHFIVRLELKQFSPEEILVKTVDDFLVVEATHEEKKDEHGFVKRSFKRRFLLPVNTNKDEVRCEINEDGVLKVVIPRIVPENGGHEKVHKLVRVGGHRNESK